MSKFTAALSAGLAAFERARRPREILARTLWHLAEDVAAATRGRVKIALRPDRSLTAALGREDPLGTTTHVFAETADAREELFSLDLHAEGFPATLAYDQLRIQCDNVEEVEREIEAYLATPHAGAIFARLGVVAMPPPPSNDAGTGAS